MALEVDATKKVRLAKELFDELNVKEDADDFKSKYQREAFEHLDKISLDSAKKEAIKNFASALLAREF